MFHNYGGCAVFIKTTPPPFVITDYTYFMLNNTAILTEYIGSGGDIITPVVPNS